MDLVEQISNVLIGSITAGLAFRVVYCCLRLIMADEETGMYKTRLRHTLVFAVIVTLVWTIKAVFCIIIKELLIFLSVVP